MYLLRIEPEKIVFRYNYCGTKLQVSKDLVDDISEYWVNFKTKITCPKCKNVNGRTMFYQTSDVIYCPHCGSDRISTKESDFSAGKAATGAILAGPIGLGAGFLGSHKANCICINCGYRFRTKVK